MKVLWPELLSMREADPISVLYCSQLSERGKLGRGQAPDPSNSKALVGSVAPSSAEGLATLHVPERDGSVIAATGQCAGIGTQLERPHHALMRFLHSHALPALHIPPAQLAITASTHHPVTARSPAQRRNHPRMPRQGTYALPAVGVPYEELPTIAAAAARGQPPVIEAPGHAHDDPMVSRQPEQQRVTSGIPHIDVAIFAHTDQPPAIGAPGHLTDRACLRAIRSTLEACSHVPYTHALQQGSAGQYVSIGAPGHTEASISEASII